MYLTVSQAAALLQVSRKTIRRRIADGSILAIRIAPNAIRIEPRALESYVDRLRAQCGAPR